MGNNRVCIIKGTTQDIDCTVSGLPDLVGYDAKLVVKKEKEDSDLDKIFEIEPYEISGLVIKFTTTAANNNIDPGMYFYEVYITKTDELRSIAIDDYQISEPVRD